MAIGAMCSRPAASPTQADSRCKPLLAAADISRTASPQTKVYTSRKSNRDRTRSGAHAGSFRRGRGRDGSACRLGSFPVRDLALVRFRLEDYALTRAAIHHYVDRFRKLQVADTALLFHGRLFRQPLPID